MTWLTQTSTVPTMTTTTTTTKKVDNLFLIDVVVLKRTDWFGLMCRWCCLTSESVQGAALPLEGIDHIHGGDSLPLGMLGVGDGIPDDILQEDLQDSPGLLVDEARDTLDTAAASQTPDGGLGDALDVVPEHLAVTLGASLAESLASLATSSHVEDYRLTDRLPRGGGNIYTLIPGSYWPGSVPPAFPGHLHRALCRPDRETRLYILRWREHRHQSKLNPRNGSYQADRQEVHRRQGPQEAAGHQGRQEERPCHRWREEAPQVQAWHSGPP